MLKGRAAARAADGSRPGAACRSPLGPPLPEVALAAAGPDAQRRAAAGDPAELAVARETIRLAFVAALQHLPPRQRAVLILCEVLRWKATEVAELLDTSVASVNSALQRARATLDAERPRAGASRAARRGRTASCSPATSTRSSATTWTSLTSLLHEDATQSMPPYELWLSGRDDILALVVRDRASAASGSRLVPTVAANGSPAFGQYKPGGPNGDHTPWALQVLELVRRRDRRVHVLPRHRDAVPALRPAAAPRAVGSPAPAARRRDP